MKLKSNKLISKSTECHSFKIVWVIESFADLNQEWGSFHSEVNSLFPDCEKCKFRLTMSLHYRAYNRAETPYNFELTPGFRHVGDQMADHLFKDHDVLKTTQIAYIVGSDGLKRCQGSQDFIGFHHRALTKSEVEENSSGIFNNGSLEFVYEIKCEASSKAHKPDNSVDKMRRLLEMGYMADLEILTKDETIIQGHQAVLALASPVFKAMFESDMEKKRESPLKLDSFDAKVVKNMIIYICTNELDLRADDGHEMALELLKMADQYQIDSLKIVCENKLIDRITTESAVDILKLSVDCRAENLRDNALKLIGANKKFFAVRDDLIELIDLNNHELTKGIMKALAS